MYNVMYNFIRENYIYIKEYECKLDRLEAFTSFNVIVDGVILRLRKVNIKP